MTAPIETARILLAQGDLDGAEKLLGNAARGEAGRADAPLNHLYGQVLHDTGKLDRAITHYRRALRLAPGVAEVHRDLGVAYETKSWLKEAAACYGEALRLDSHDELAHSYLGRVLRAQGEIVPALRHFVRAATAKLTRPFRALARNKRVAPPDPGHASLLEEARVAFNAKRFVEAEEKVKALLQLAPRNASALALYARICGKTNRLDQGTSFAQQAVALEVNEAELRLTLGELLLQAERLDEAAAIFEAVLKLDPNNARAWAQSALVAQRLDRAEEAELRARRAVELDPNSAFINNVLGFVLVWCGKFADCETYCREAVRLNPISAGPFLNLANSLKERGRVDEARLMVQQGAAKLPDEAMSYCHLAGFELDMGEIEAAIQHTRRALILEPGQIEAHMMLANLLLLSGRHEEGWQEYEWRKRYRAQARLHDSFRQRLEGVRQWVGTALEGRTLLVHCEQALGEQILFSSCVPEVAARAKAVTLLCYERLPELLSRSLPEVRVMPVARGEDMRDYTPGVGHDLWCAVGSLPGLLKRDDNTLPGPLGYLKPDPLRVERWRARLAGLGEGRKVGLSWRGGVIATGRFKRSMDLAALRPILEVPGIRWVNMQYGKPEEEIAALREQTGIDITHWREGIDDFDEHAALAAALDHRITACNTLVHLSGGMGLKTWVLSPPATIWPYGLGDRMPWYPSVEIYRQQRYKDWSAPVADLARDLRALGAGL